MVNTSDLTTPATTTCNDTDSVITGTSKISTPIASSAPTSHLTTPVTSPNKNQRVKKVPEVVEEPQGLRRSSRSNKGQRVIDAGVVSFIDSPRKTKRNAKDTATSAEKKQVKTLIIVPCKS